MPKPKMPKISFKMPRVHKITVQQGNVITQEMIDRLKPGMTREQVAFVMGEPVVPQHLQPRPLGLYLHHRGTRPLHGREARDPAF